VRIQGPDRKGEGARIASRLAAASLNVRGFAAAAIGKTCMAHAALDSAADAAGAVRALKNL
jgi:hypothetical protein